MYARVPSLKPQPRHLRRFPSLLSTRLSIIVIPSILLLLFRSPNLKRHIPRFSLHATLPPTISSVFNVPRNTSNAAFHSSHEFSKPMVMTSYVRPSSFDESLFEVYVFMTGVSMGWAQRNFSVAGCLVGNDVYETERFRDDVLRCQLPRQVTSGERISVVLFLDEVLEEAIDGPVTLVGGYVATLDEGDVVPLHENVRLHDGLGQLEKEKYRAIRSRERYNGLAEASAPGRSREEPRFRLCLMTQIKPFADMIPDWVDYHRRIGVDKVFVFDNGAEEDLEGMYSGRDDVEIVYWPWQTSQNQAFSFFLIASRARCEWVLFSDVDEYVMFGIGDNDDYVKDVAPFKQHLSMLERERIPQYQFFYLEMVNSGYVRRPDMPVAEAYTHRKEPQRGVNGKSVCWSDRDWLVSEIHTCKESGNGKVAWMERRREFKPRSKNDIPSVVHFQFRGIAEYAIKNRAGRQTTRSFLKSAEEEKAKKERIKIGDKVPNEKIATDGEGVKTYDHFRGIWRRISKQMMPVDMMVVQERGNLRCTKEYAKGEDESISIREECSRRKVIEMQHFKEFWKNKKYQTA